MGAQEIKRKALQLGYTACGVIPSVAFDEYSQHLEERVKAFPASRELYKPLYDLIRPPENSRSIIVCTRRYNRYKIPDGLDGLIGKLYLFDSRISYAHEYRAKIEFEIYLKTRGMNISQGNMPVRWAAAKAGLGKFGRNNFIYSPEHGSYIWIDAWAVDMELEYDVAPENTLVSACNEKCHMCVKACPTKALSNGLSMDRGKCIAHISFYSTDIPKEDIRSQLGSWIYGCDACQDVCPLNKDKFMETEEFPLLSEFEEYLRPEDILNMNEDIYANVIYPRFWYAGKDGLWLWKCNALRSMINSGQDIYHHLIKQCCNNTDKRLSIIAKW